MLGIKGCLHGAIATAIFITINGLDGIQCKCSHSVIATVTLNPKQTTSCDEQIAVAKEPCGQAFKLCCDNSNCRISIVFESTENIFGHDDFNNVNTRIMEETEEPTMTPTDLLERLGLLEFYPQRLTVQVALEKTFSLPDLQTEEGSISTQQLPWYFLMVSYISS